MLSFSWIELRTIRSALCNKPRRWYEISLTVEGLNVPQNEINNIAVDAPTRCLALASAGMVLILWSKNWSFVVMF